MKLTRALRRRLAAVAFGLLLVAAPVAGRAQIRLPGVALPDLTRLPPALRAPLPAIDDALDRVPLDRLRQRHVAELLRRHGDVLEADPNGAPVVRGELLWIAPPPGLRDAALALGFVQLRARRVEALDALVLVLGPPPGIGLDAARQRLLALDPTAEVDFNHVYTPSGEVSGADGSLPGTVAAATEGAPAATRVGLVDGGVDAAHAALRASAIHRHGCGDHDFPSAHGTAVASLLVGKASGFQGAAPGATLYAADVYCAQPTGGSVDAVAEALGWLAAQPLAVINISLVGPPNRLLERLVRALTASGHLLVAAVGNDGPAAPPLYPAAYPGVVGVTGVTAQRRVLPEAAQGPQVAFAAPGADLAVAGEGGYVRARGTSFAAPWVAGLLATDLVRPEAGAAARSLARLAGNALDLGDPGRDPVYGAGLVAESLRTDPRSVGAAAQTLR